MTVVRLPSSIEVIVSRPILCTFTLGTGECGAADAVVLAAGALVSAEVRGVAAAVVAAAVVAATVVSAGFVAAGVATAGVATAGVASAGVASAGVASAGVVSAGFVAAGVAAAAGVETDPPGGGVLDVGVAVSVFPPTVAPLFRCTCTTGFWPGWSTMRVVRVPSSIERIVSFPIVWTFTFGDSGVGVAVEDADAAADDWLARLGGGDGSASFVPAGVPVSFAWAPCASCGRSLSASVRWLRACRG
jgi:hypothetical protein